MMKLFLFTILVCCAVNCEDVGNNYYVIEMPDNDVPNTKKPFQVYWNVPTMQCQSKQIPFNDLYEKFGIIQNEGDKFRGEKITIMYEPGLFPAIFKNETSGKYRFRNGGVPQEGNLEDHLAVFKKDMQEIVPDPDFNGIGIIDFESWRPIFRQNFGTLVPYKDVSIEIEKKLHWWWPKPWIQNEAQRRFESSARTFMQTTLSIAKQMRPKALWGYYGFPQCFNMANVRNLKEKCPSNVISENDITRWLWLESTALYPSVYSSRDLSSSQLGLLVRGRVEEAYRVRRYDTPILPYFWFRYRDGGFMKEEDLTIVLQSLYKSKASGFIIWGSSNDVNTVSKCQKLHEYLETILGPTIAKYLQKINRVDDTPVESPTENNLNNSNETLTTVEDIISTTDKHIINDTINNLNSASTTKAQFDPEFDWVPPENYSQDIAHNVDEELSKKGYDTIEEKDIGFKLLNDSMITGILFDALFKSEYSKENNKQTTRGVQNETFIKAIDIATKAPQFESKDNFFITKEPNYTEDYKSKEIITNDVLINSTPKLNSNIFIENENETTELNSDSNPTNINEDELTFTENNKSTDIIVKDFYINSTNTKDSILEENDTLSTIPPSAEEKDTSDEIHLEIIDPDGLMNIIFNAIMNDNFNQADKSDKQTTFDNNIIVNDQNFAQNIKNEAKTSEILENCTINEEIIDSSTEKKFKDFRREFPSITNTDIDLNTEKYSIDRSSVESILSINNGYTNTELDDFLIVSVDETENGLNVTTQNNKNEDLISDQREVESVSIGEISDSDTKVTTDSVTETNSDSVVINSESSELRSTDSDMYDTATESLDQVVTYVYHL